jgi:hypothetical protein
MRQMRPRDARWVSACLFGHQHKLELLDALADAPDGRINLGAVAKRCGVPPAVYYPPVRDLMALELLSQVARVPGDRRQWYQRSGGDQLWAEVGSLVRSLHLLAPATSQPASASTPVSTA